MRADHTIRTEAELAALYEEPSTSAVRKRITILDDHCRAYIEASPLVLVATCGPTGADCSPRGESPGFVQIQGNRLLIPDRPGNNRLDTLRNLLASPAIGLLFVVPGVYETLRVNGMATISVAPDHLEACAESGVRPVSVLLVEVTEAFIQGPRALRRADLWNPGRFREPASLPSFDTVLTAHAGTAADLQRDRVDPAEQVSGPSGQKQEG